MKIPAYHPRIAGMHVAPDGRVSVVWLAIDPNGGGVTLYDTLAQAREVLVLRARAIQDRGKQIPVAWFQDAEDIVTRLRDEYDVEFCDKPVKDSEGLAETYNQDLRQRMKTGGFKVLESQGAWQREYKQFSQGGAAVARDAFPLMAATRCAIVKLDDAQPLTRNKGQVLAPKFSMV